MAEKMRAGRLQGKVALITGAADGQGRAAARLFAAEGARVFGCDLKLSALGETCRLVRESGGRMETFGPIDLGDREATKAWIEASAAEAGRIDILYNNAAAVRFGGMAETPLADWAFTLRNELDLIFHACQAVWPHLKVNGGGAIVNTASTSALHGSRALGAGAHAAAKGGVIALTRQLAAEGAPHAIRVNAISPGMIQTPATDWLGEAKGGIAATNPLGRNGRPEDVAYCALFLASDAASWVTGGNFVVDGGASAIR
jgi:meso-butanediol dehydrogenase/(S,S)-butanediol dehydrogenase/diacetyl reductase